MDPLVLSKPIQHGKQEITELMFRDPIARDFRQFPVGKNPTIGEVLDVASLLCNVPPVVLWTMAPSDAVRVTEIVLGFLEPGPPTGKTLSP